MQRLIVGSLIPRPPASERERGRALAVLWPWGSGASPLQRTRAQLRRTLERTPERSRAGSRAVGSPHDGSLAGSRERPRGDAPVVSGAHRWPPAPAPSVSARGALRP